MEVNPTDSPIDLVETDVIKPLETRPADLPHPVVGNQEGLLPAHEHVLALRKVLVVEIRFLSAVFEGPPRGEAGPVQHVGLVGGAPGGVARLKGVLAADDLAFEVGGQGGVVFGEAFDAQVAAKEGLGHVDVLDVDFDLVVLPVGLLRPNEFAAGAQERGGVAGEELAAGCVSGAVCLQAVDLLTRTLERYGRDAMLCSAWYSGPSSSCWSLPSELPLLLELRKSDGTGLKPDIVEIERRSIVDESESESIVGGLKCVVWGCGCCAELVLCVDCCGGAPARAASVAPPSLDSSEGE